MEDISKDHDVQAPIFYVSASLDCQCVTLAVGFQLASVEIMAEIVVNLDPRIDTISNEKGEGQRNVREICPTLDVVPVAGVD